MSFNPPPSANNWANIEALDDKKGRLKHHSTYLDVPPEWLGAKFIQDAIYLKSKNEMAYNNEYLGKVTGIGGNIFKNIIAVTITDEEILTYERIRQGLDFGFTVDPTAFIKLCYQRNRNSITPFDELFEYGISTKLLSEEVNKKCNRNEIIKADSQEGRTINTMATEYNVNVIGCVKGPGSVEHGTKFLQDLDEIRIDRKRTPNTYREFTTYEYERNKDGEFIKKYPDKNNHCMAEDTKVITDKGIKLISEITKGTILSFNTITKLPEYKPFYDCRKTGIEKLYKIKTSNGKIIKCTDYHPILTTNGYKTIKTLKKGDKIIDISNRI